MDSCFTVWRTQLDFQGCWKTLKPKAQWSPQAPSQWEVWGMELSKNGPVAVGMTSVPSQGCDVRPGLYSGGNKVWKSTEWLLPWQRTSRSAGMSITVAGKVQVQWTSCLQSNSEGAEWSIKASSASKSISRNESRALMDWLNMFEGFEILMWDSNTLTRKRRDLLISGPTRSGPCEKW